MYFSILFDRFGLIDEQLHWCYCAYRFYFFFCTDVIVQCCMVLECNRTLLWQWCYMPYICCTDVIVHICRTFSIDTDVIMPMLLHWCYCAICIIVVLRVLEPVIWHMMLLCHQDSGCYESIGYFCISLLQLQFRDSE